MAKKRKLLEPVTPGEVLLEDFLKPMGISQNRLGRELDVPITRINEIVNGKRVITVDTAMRLTCYFGTTPEGWRNGQQQYDSEIARRNLMPELEEIIIPFEDSESEAA